MTLNDFLFSTNRYSKTLNCKFFIFTVNIQRKGRQFEMKATVLVLLFFAAVAVHGMSKVIFIFLI